jgi:Ca2+-transporting ATPase
VKAQVKEALKGVFSGTEKEPAPVWHVLDGHEAVSFLNTDRGFGLSREEAAERLQRDGPNMLPELERRSGWRIFLEQLNSLPVYLLAAAAGISIAMGGIVDALVIAGVVVANAAVGCYTESRAESTVASLSTNVHPSADVIRDGCHLTVAAEEVVRGDLLVLRPGTCIAADCRILEVSRLSIDESMLTGESMPVEKIGRVLDRKDLPLGDRYNMAFMGTLVTGGEGLAVVTATGRDTEIGHLQVLLGGARPPQTPIERQLDQMGNHLVWICGSICGMVFFIGFLRGYGVLQMLRVAVSLAAAAVPEGLPAAATVNFALGVNRMKAHGVLIRKLQAVETLGAVQTVCLDKTGTLTRNRMSVQQVSCGTRKLEMRDGRLVDGAGAETDPAVVPELDLLLRTGILCSDVVMDGFDEAGSLQLHGSSTETALIHLAVSCGIDAILVRDRHRLVKAGRRSESRLFMGTVHRDDRERVVCSVKGSPPDVFSLCTARMVDGEIVPLSESDRLEIETENARLAGSAMRVLGFAYVIGSGEDFCPEEEMVWLGLVGMADPLRPGVEDLICGFHRAGIETVMITGDQSTTAYAVAGRIGLSGEAPLEILESESLAEVDDKTLSALAQKVHVYARVSPSHKLRIVQALQENGKTVAMSGDGINDGPALKAADIGVAMGDSGTDLAREVADVVLEEDDLRTLLIAVRDGRTSYRNIRKSVRFFLSTNFSEIVVMSSAMALGIGFPLNVMQLLWINLISDIFPGLALAMEEPEEDVMKDPPRDPKQPLFTAADYRRIAAESTAIGGSALSAYGYGLIRYGAGMQAGTMAFHALTLGQLLHAISCRSERSGIFDAGRRNSNPYLSLAVGGSIAIQVLAAFVPGLRSFLGLSPLSLLDTAVIAASAVFPLLINETGKTKVSGFSVQVSEPAIGHWSFVINDQ